MLLCAAWGVTYLVEQPASSMLRIHPKVISATHWTNGHEARFSTGNFGKGSLKPTYCVCNAQWVMELAKMNKLKASTRTC